MTCELIVNGHRVTVDVPPMTPLLEVLREHLGLRGAKPGCGEGRCGACTVRHGDRTVASCLLPVALVTDPVTTIEGVAAPDGALHPVQDALLEHGGVQCGACIPGMVMSICAHLDAEPEPDERSVRAALVGNICRCTGYHKIVEAALAAGRAVPEAGR